MPLANRSRLLLVVSLLGCRAPASDHEPKREIAAARASSAPKLEAAPLLPPPEPSAAPQAPIVSAVLRPPSQPEPLPPDVPGEARVYAKTRFVWVYAEPDASRQWIGFLRSGSSAKLRSPKPRPGPGCDAFVAIEPKGYVCADGGRATLSADDPVYRAVRPYAAKADSATPHQYGESLGLPRYLTAPTLAEQRWRERDYTSHQRAVARARSGDVPTWLEGVDFAVPDRTLELPAFPVTMFEDRKELKARSTVAYSGEARFGDRAFLLTADFAWVPKDRVRTYPPVDFHGVELGDDSPPFAFVRRKSAPKYEQTQPGEFAARSEEAFPHLATIVLTGARREAGGERYCETTLPNVWVRARDVVIPLSQARTPWGEPLAQGEAVDPAVLKSRPKGRATWIEVSIEGGWLMAYEGTRRMFATLISPGKGGVAKPDEDPLKRAATPTGVYPITGKFVTSTMEAPNDLIHSDVPYAQNLVGPYALHGAYWHDNWGNPQSGGCVNLAPIDAKWLFDFTEPKLPPGWHGVRWLPSEGPATIVVLHR